MQVITVNRFQTRKAASDFAKKFDAKVERCAKYSDGFFPYQVLVVKEVKKK